MSFRLQWQYDSMTSTEFSGSLQTKCSFWAYLKGAEEKKSQANLHESRCIIPGDIRLKSSAIKDPILSKMTKRQFNFARTMCLLLCKLMISWFLNFLCLTGHKEPTQRVQTYAINGVRDNQDIFMHLDFLGKSTNFLTHWQEDFICSQSHFWPFHQVNINLR